MSISFRYGKGVLCYSVIIFQNRSWCKMSYFPTLKYNSDFSNVLSVFNNAINLYVSDSELSNDF